MNRPATYFGFLAWWVVVPLLALAVIWPAFRAVEGRMLAAGLVLLAVYVFTTPWDNWAVFHKTWDFPAGRYWRRLGWLPVEEYLFFGLQSVLVMGVVNGLLGWCGGRESCAMFEAGAGAPAGAVDFASPLVWVPLAAVLLGWLATGLLGWRKFPAGGRGFYAWHLLFWFVPILLVQWAFGWAILAPRVDLIVLPALLVGSWLVLADLAAIRAGLWFFDERQITGWKWRGIVPWEELAFFYLTSLLVAQSYLLLLPEALR